MNKDKTLEAVFMMTAEEMNKTLMRLPPPFKKIYIESAIAGIRKTDDDSLGFASRRPPSGRTTPEGVIQNKTRHAGQAQR